MTLPGLRWSLRLTAGLLLAVLPGAGAGAGAGTGVGTEARVPAESRRPARIVSLNLCADQLVFALADRSQIAGLTRNATNAELSAVAGSVRGLPILGGSAEEVMAAAPDLVIGMPARGSPATVALDARNYRAVDLKSADNYAAILVSIRDVAKAVGHPARGEVLIARMNAELASLPRAAKPRVAAYYQRRGFVTGAGTLMDDLMGRTGLVNLAGKLGRPVLSQVSLEEMTAAAPDHLIVDSATQQITDRGTEMLHHPVLRGIPRIAIPQAWTVCGGPAYVKAARAMALAVAAR